MAHANGTYDEAALMTRPTAELNRLGSRSMIIAGVGIVASVAGYAVVGDRFWQSYLIAFLFWIGICLGSLAILMVQHLTAAPGRWPRAGCSKRPRAICP
jgi:hypothetical protein